MPSNADIEFRITPGITDLLRKEGMLPDDYECEVHLHRGGRKKRRNAAFEQNWDPDTDYLRIEFLPAEQKPEGSRPSSATDLSGDLANAGPAANPLWDLLRALDRAEGRPGYEFVSLKWFRDTALTFEGFDWAGSENARHDMLREAIERRWILTSKVANPRSPRFPTTAIRLNRQMPEVSAALGRHPGSLPALRPVTIRGESLSATVMRDRR